jgi:D-amino-acid oxidase
MKHANGERAIVVGAGISGLSCAHELLAAGFEVEVWAREPATRSVSTVAAAFWYPYQVDPPERVLEWARRAYQRFCELARRPATGVTLHEAIEVFPAAAARPLWADAVPDFRDARPEELPPGRTHGFCFTAPVIETPIYAPWLRAEVERAGGRFVARELRSLAPALEAAPVVVNASGLGARELVGDTRVHPVRGQIMSIENPGLARVLVDEHGPDGIAYVVPRSGDCVLGGTFEPDVPHTAPDPAAREAILERCRALEPALASAALREDKVGLRPCRDAVRLELEEVDDGRVIAHDYGHGGAGVTLSWGCAGELVDLLVARARRQRSA